MTSAQHWANFVRDITHGDMQTVIAQRSGIHQTTISRWLNGESTRMRAETIVQLARSYDANVLEALIAAGVITPTEAGVAARARVDVSTIATSTLLREVSRRTQGAA